MNVKDKEEEEKELENNINACYQASSDYSSTLSAICRQMAFAEGALYWFLYTGFNLAPKYVIVGYLFLLFYFFTDLFQYLSGYVAFKKKAKKMKSTLRIK